MVRDFAGEPPFDAVLPVRKRATNPEWKLHATCAKLCYQRERADPNFRFFSPGGEGQRSPARAAIAKQMGQNRRGCPDMWLLRPGKIVCVEFKRPGGRLSDDQLDWRIWLEHAGIGFHLCTSVEQFRTILAMF